MSMFESLANRVIKRHRAIIIIWLVILLLAVPYVSHIGNVVEYEETSMAPPDIESERANNLMSEQFGGSLDNSSIIIVFEGDVGTPAARDYLLNLENQIEKNRDIRYLNNVTSIYSVEQEVFEGEIKGIAPAIHETENGVNASATLLFATPSMHIQYWLESYNTSGNMSAADEYAYQQTAMAVNYMNMSDYEKYSILQYYNLFAQFWNVSASNMSLAASPQLRGESAINSAASLYTSQMEEIEAATLLSVRQAINLTTWSNASRIQEIALSFFSSVSGIENMSALNEIHALGPRPDNSSVTALAESFVRNSTYSTPPLPLPEEVIEGFVSRNVTIMFIGFSRSSNDAAIKDNTGIIRDLVHAEGSPVKAYVSGDVAIGMDMEEESNRDMERIDPITIILIFVLIGAFFLSLVAPAVPVGSIGMAVITAMAAIYLLSGIIGNIHYSVLPMLVTAMFGAGSDYAIFIISRYREERLRGHDKEESVRTSVRWAGESITTSGITVMIAFGSLSLTSFPMTQTMGIAIALGIGIALLVALTFIPSLLLVLGDRVFWPGHKRWDRKREKMGTGYFHKSAHFSLKHAKAIVLAALILSVPATYAIMEMETGFDFIAGMPQTESKEGMTVMSDGFGKGIIMPTYVVIRFYNQIYDSTTGEFNQEEFNALENISAEFSSYQGIQTVYSPTRPDGKSISPADLSASNGTTDGGEIASALSYIAKDGRTVMIKIILADDPLSRDSMNVIDKLRDFRGGFVAQHPDLIDEFLVGGSTAGMVDISSVFNSDFHVMEVVVIIGIFLVLMFILGSVFVPLRLILTILLSISWTLATTYVLFHYILNTEVLWLIPLILFVISMGLGMDYDIFLTTRVREEVLRGKDDRAAVVTAVETTGGIISACGLIMAGTFGTLLLSGMSMLQEFGFALAFLVLLDSMIVRIYLVPAIMVILEKWNWWAPGPLQRVNRNKED